MSRHCPPSSSASGPTRMRSDERCRSRKSPSCSRPLRPIAINDGRRRVGRRNDAAQAHTPPTTAAAPTRSKPGSAGCRTAPDGVCDPPDSAGARGEPWRAITGVTTHDRHSISRRPFARTAAERHERSSTSRSRLLTPRRSSSSLAGSSTSPSVADRRPSVVRTSTESRQSTHRTSRARPGGHVHDRTRSACTRMVVLPARANRVHGGAMTDPLTVRRAVQPNHDSARLEDSLTALAQDHRSPTTQQGEIP